MLIRRNESKTDNKIKQIENGEKKRQMVSFNKDRWGLWWKNRVFNVFILTIFCIFFFLHSLLEALLRLMSSYDFIVSLSLTNHNFIYCVKKPQLYLEKIFHRHSPNTSHLGTANRKMTTFKIESKKNKSWHRKQKVLFWEVEKSLVSPANVEPVPSSSCLCLSPTSFTANVISQFYFLSLRHCRQLP